MTLRRSIMPIDRRTLLRAAALSTVAASTPALAGKTSSPNDTLLYIIWPHNGDRVRGHAGDATPNLGHHHLLLDVDEPLDIEQPIPSDKNHLHFGAGQTETRLDLSPGRHTLQLVLGDAEHLAFVPPVASRKITITVV